MTSVQVRELNQHTSAVLARVQRGERVQVTAHGHPIAQLVPVDRGLTVLDQLVADGKAAAPTIVGPVPRPRTSGDPTENVAEQLVADREAERW